MQDCKTLLAHGSFLNIYLEEYYKLEDIVLQEQLTKELGDMDSGAIILDKLRQLLSRAHACNLPTNSKYMVLRSKLQAGNDWDKRALKMLAQPIKTIEEPGHAAYNKVCPKYLEMLLLYKHWYPSNRFKYFPTAEPWTWQREGEPAQTSAPRRILSPINRKTPQLSQTRRTRALFSLRNP